MRPFAEINRLIRHSCTVCASAAFLTLLQAETTKEKVYGVADINEAPVAVLQPVPAYPYEMANAGIEGLVKVEFVLNTEGRVQDARVIFSSDQAFERPAMEAIQKWKYRPAKIKGVPVNVRSSQTIGFGLEGVSFSDKTLNVQVLAPKKQPNLPADMQWTAAPKIYSTPMPVYPFEALRNQLAGKAIVQAVVDGRGVVQQTATVSATSPEFGYAAQAAADGMTFVPARMADDRPARAVVFLTLEFKPDGKGDVPVGKETRNILQSLEKTPEAIIPLANLDRAPERVNMAIPVYPRLLGLANQAGEAEVEVFIDKTGRVRLSRIVSASAPAFGYAAVQAVSTWQFKAPRKNGKAVVARVVIPVGFAPR